MSGVEPPGEAVGGPAQAAAGVAAPVLAALGVGIVVLLVAWLLVQRARGPKKEDA